MIERLLRDPDRRWVMATKQRVAAVICSPAVGRVVVRATGGIVSTRGLKVDVRTPGVGPEVAAQLVCRTYEGAELRLLDAHLRATPCVVDLGCSLGVLASAAARTLPVSARVIGVEADPELIEIARQNIARNAPWVDVEVVHGAVDYSRPAGSTTRLSRGGSHLASALSGRAGDGFGAPVLRLGELLEQRRIGAYTLLMDIEGAEAGLVLDDPDAFGSCQQIIAELHEGAVGVRRMSRDDLRRAIVELGFGVEASYGSVFVFGR